MKKLLIALFGASMLAGCAQNNLLDMEIGSNLDATYCSDSRMYKTICYTDKEEQDSGMKTGSSINALTLHILDGLVLSNPTIDNFELLPTDRIKINRTRNHELEGIQVIFQGRIDMSLLDIHERINQIIVQRFGNPSCSTDVHGKDPYLLWDLKDKAVFLQEIHGVVQLIISKPDGIYIKGFFRHCYDLSPYYFLYLLGN